jgi:hypothetical protein
VNKYQNEDTLGNETTGKDFSTLKEHMNKQIPLAILCMHNEMDWEARPVQQQWPLKENKPKKKKKK